MSLADLRIRYHRRRERAAPHAAPAAADEAESLIDSLDRQCVERPDHVVMIDGASRLTFDDIRSRARRLAASLVRMGIKPGDVISMQLPNWHEAAVITVASAILRAIINPIVPIYRQAELAFILNDAHSRIIFIPSIYRGHDFVSMIANLPVGATIITVRGIVDGQHAYERLLADGDEQYSVPDDERDFAPYLLMYTSGTTARAKGVVHDQSSIAVEIGAVSRFWGVRADDHILMPSPISHITGLLYGIEMPLRTGAKVSLMDAWIPADAVELIDATGVSLMVGATPFLGELVEAAASSGSGLHSLRLFGCGGAPVPPELVRRALAQLPNCLTTRIYGSTEAPTVTLGARTRDESAIAADTDGYVVGYDLKIERAGASDGDEGGEILVRGPELFCGYLSEEDELSAFDDEGFFRTGDLGSLVEGVLTVTGRMKDLIIRGGENISPKEIEDVILACLGVREVAVVSAPSSRMGEAVCAFITAHTSTDVLEALLSCVEASGLAKQKWPERIIVTDELPKTPSGKIRKDLLRKIAADDADLGWKRPGFR